jgi:hypothetical protein
MTDELDAWLNRSSPKTSESPTIDGELTALAYSTQRLARARRRSLWRRVGIPLVVGAMALGGTGAALASPTIQRSLGIIQSQPRTVKPFPKVDLVLPISGCTLTLQVVNGSTERLDVRGIESLQAATNYLSHVDIASIEQSDLFKANYRPTPLAGQTGESADQIATENQAIQELNRANEQQAVSQALSPGMIDAADKSGQEPQAVGMRGWMKCPGSPS